MVIEVIITIALVSFAIYIFYSKTRKKLSGECCCYKDNKNKKKCGK